MARALVERVAETVRKRDKSARSRNRAVVLAHRDAIAEALDAGFSVKDVWETLRTEGVVASSYQAFRGHVNRTVLCRKTAPAAASPSKLAVRTSGLPGFTFDSKPDKKELL